MMKKQKNFFTINNGSYVNGTGYQTIPHLRKDARNVENGTNCDNYGY